MKNFVKTLTAALFLTTILLLGCKKNTDDNPGGSNITVNRNPLCFTAEEAGATIEMTGGDPSIRFEYSYDGNNWNTFTPDATLITLNNVGDVVYFRGNNPNGLTPIWIPYPPDPSLPSGYYSYIHFVTNDKKISASGNIMSLIDKTCSTLTIPNKKCFIKLFRETSITTAPELPATVLSDSCYSNMFVYCRHLITPPELPASNMTVGCYSNMFTGCRNLKRAPDLPATHLAPFCYVDMFSGCNSLIIAPQLPATNLASSCYAFMFAGCKSLTTAPNLPATNLARSCYIGMFQNCTKLYQAPELPATTLAEDCYSAMFACDIEYESESMLSAAPNLPATILAPRCYMYMFGGCVNLRTAPELPATELVTDCYNAMFVACRNLNNICIHFEQWNSDTELWVGEYDYYNSFSSQGTFRCPASLPIEFGPDRIPEGWTVETF